APGGRRSPPRDDQLPGTLVGGSRGSGLMTERAATEAGGLAELPFLLAADLTACVEGVHTAVAGRSFAAVGVLGRPVRAVHDRIATTVYAAIRGSAALLGRAAAKATQTALPARSVS